MLRISLLSTLFLCAYGARLPSVPELDGRIVGGYPIEIEEVPYQVSLIRNSRHYCGGSIISETIILSAAHCTLSPPSDYKIRAGSSRANSGGQVVDVSKIINHIEYNVPSRANNDISLIFLASTLTLGTSVALVTLPSQGQTVDDDALSFTTGWGSLWDGGPFPDQLQKVTISIINQEKCVKAYSTGPRPVTNNMICAGNFDEGGQDACGGDSGGPLIVDDVLVGVTSWGRGCASAGYPGVWARVPNYITWINDHIL